MATSRHIEHAVSEHAVDRYVGLVLGGAKSNRTCLAVIDYYRRQKKAFLVEIFESISSGASSNAHEGQNSDQVLLEVISELSKDFSELHGQGIRALAVDAPLTLPPCLASCKLKCRGYERCTHAHVKWMRQQYEKAKQDNPKLKYFTPYTQRPVDLYFRYANHGENLFQDETLGANLAPQAARMNYLKRHLTKIELIEVWPKLCLHYLQKPLHLSKRDIVSYRHIEHGTHVRNRILEKLTERAGLFVYDRDFKKMITNVGAFEAFICAWVAVEYSLGHAMKFRSDVPLDSGWVQVPDL